MTNETEKIKNRILFNAVKEWEERNFEVINRKEQNIVNKMIEDLRQIKERGINNNRQTRERAEIKQNGLRAEDLI